MSIDTLQPLTLNSCEEVSAALTSRAAFSINVRAFLLVRDKQAFCSSATGPMNTPMEKLIPQLHISKPVDIALLPGTPMLPGATGRDVRQIPRLDQHSGLCR